MGAKKSTAKKGSTKKVAPAPATPEKEADLGASTPAETPEVETLETPATPEAETPEDAQERLDAEVDAETAPPAEQAAVAPAGDSEVVTKKGVKTLNPPPRKFVAVGTDIFNPKGVHVGAERTENEAGRKAERFNDLSRQHKLTA